MNKNQQTAYGLKELLTMLTGLPQDLDEFTTVNQRLQIQENAIPTANEPIRMKVLMAGIGGHGYAPGTSSIPLISSIDHAATDASLYTPLPLALRDIDDDLPAARRNRYAFRKIMAVNGINKISYWGYRINIDPSNASVQMQKVTQTESGSVIEPFIPTNTNLYPTQPDLPTSGAITASNVSIRVSSLIKVMLNQEDIEEFMEAVRVMYDGDERYAIMSEFALVTGADRIVEVESSTGFINFNEVIGARIYGFAMEHKSLQYNTQRLEIDFDLGNQIPLFAAESIPTMQVIP